MKEMSCLDFNEFLINEGEFSELHSDFYFSGGIDTMRYLKVFVNQAEKRKIKLNDLNDFDYEKVFVNNYEHDYDKGLS